MYGNGNLNTAEFWEYDPRLGRRWDVDPVVKSYEASYVAFSDNPLIYVDPTGKNKDWYETRDDNGGIVQKEFKDDHDETITKEGKAWTNIGATQVEMTKTNMNRPLGYFDRPLLFEHKQTAPSPNDAGITLEDVEKAIVIPIIETIVENEEEVPDRTKLVQEPAETG